MHAVHSSLGDRLRKVCVVHLTDEEIEGRAQRGYVICLKWGFINDKAQTGALPLGCRASTLRQGPGLSSTPPPPLNTLTNITQVPPIARQTQAADPLLLLQARPTIVARAGDTVT